MNGVAILIGRSGKISQLGEDLEKTKKWPGRHWQEKYVGRGKGKLKSKALR